MYFRKKKILNTHSHYPHSSQKKKKKPENKTNKKQSNPYHLET